MRTRIWFDPPLFRWSRVLGVATVGVAAAVGWLAHERGVWPEQDHVAVVTVPSAPASTPSAPARLKVATLAASSAASAVRVAPRPAPVVTAGDDCSLGAKVVASGATDDDSPLEARLSGPRSRWLDALQAEQDPAVRAAGLLWALRAPTGATGEQARAAARDRLARLAVDSSDPAVYGLAMLGCESRSAGACQMLSMDQWVHVDPDNAAVWLVQAERAGAGTSTQAEALRRAAQSRNVRMPASELLALVRRATPNGLSDVERSLLSRELLAVQAAAPAPIGGASTFCSRANVVDANRRGDCEALATMLIERGAVLAHFIAGRAVAENLGWPADRLAALRKESEALAALAVVPADEAFSCRAIDRRTQRALDAARYGELGALRRELQGAAKTGTDIATSTRP